MSDEREGGSVASDASITATQKPRSSFRDVVIMLSLVFAGFVVLMVGGAVFLLRSDPQPTRKFSSKAEQIQALMDSYSQADCEHNDAAIKSVYHTMTAEEKAARYFCTLKAMKAQTPEMFEEAIKPMRAQPPDPVR